MATRYTAQFQSYTGQVYTIIIDDTDHTGDPDGTLDVSRPGFRIEWAGGEDVFHPIIPSTCSVPIYLKSVSDEALLTDLVGAAEGRFRLVIRRGDGEDQPLYWVGIITMDNVSIEDVAFPYVVTLKAVDGLQLLSRQQYANTGDISFIGQVLYCLDAIGTSDLFTTDGTAQPLIRATTNTEPDVATYDDPLTDVKLNPYLWDINTQQYVSDGMSLERFLTEMARVYNSRVYMSNGSFWFDNVNAPLNAPSNGYVRPFLSDGTENANEAITRIKIISGDNTTQNRRLAGWSREFIPPVSKVTRPMTIGEGLILSNTNVGGALFYPNGYTGGAQNPVYTFTTDNTIPSGSTFRVSGRCSIDAEYLGVSSAPLARPSLNIRYRVGDATTNRFLRRDVALDADVETTVQADAFNTTSTDQDVLNWGDPDGMQWTTSNAHRYKVGGNYLNYDLASDYITGPDDRVVIEFDFETPGTPVALPDTIQVTFYVNLFNQGGGAASQTIIDATACDIEFSVRAGDGYNGATALYQASTSNGATEQRVEDEVQLTSQVTFTNNTYWNPNELYNVNGGLPNWVSSSQTTAAGLNEIAVRDQLQYFSAVRTIFQGSLYAIGGDLIGPHLYVYDYNLTKWFLIVSMAHSGDDDTYDLELHECTTDDTLVMTSSVTKPVGKPLPSVGQSSDDLVKRIDRDTASHAANFVRIDSDITDLTADVNEVRATSDSSGGASSVLLQYLGDVKISGPTNGQILQYNTTAGRWANVDNTGGTDNSLSETDQTIDEGVTRKIILDGAVSNLSYFKIVDAADSPVFSITNYGTILNIVEYFGLIAYRSTSTVRGSFALYEDSANGTNYIQFQAPSSIASNRIFTMPGDYGTNGDVLQTNGTGVLSWATPFSYITLQSSFYSSDGNFDYVPIGGTLAETVSNQYYNIWTAPADGELVKATCICSTTGAGSTTITVRKYPIPQTLASDTQTIPSTAYTTATFTFTGATFSAGDRLQFGFDPTGTPGGVQITFLIKLNH